MLRRFLARGGQVCAECKKKLPEGEIGFFDKEKAILFCNLCGKKSYTNKLEKREEITKCSSCLNSLDEKEIFICQDTEEKFCSLECFRETHGIFCLYCGEKEKNANDLEETYLKVLPKSDRFFILKIIPLLIAISAALFLIIGMTLSLSREEKRKMKSKIKK